jgi:hypothetical protein
MQAVIATTPQGMIAAQPKLLEWCEARIGSGKQDLSLAEQTFNSLQRAKMRTNPASAQIRKARHRISFYEKVAAAIKLGYYIVPPFELQVFAIRTDKTPYEAPGENSYGSEHSASALPIGKGKYVDPKPARVLIGTEKRNRSYGEKAEYDAKIYDNADDFNAVGLPLRAQRPEIIDAVAGALEQKIFDALGIAPAYRAADPIICGQIVRPEKNKAPITFFVAWWLDQSDL